MSMLFTHILFNKDVVLVLNVFIFVLNADCLLQDLLMEQQSIRTTCGFLLVMMATKGTINSCFEKS